MEKQTADSQLTIKIPSSLKSLVRAEAVATDRSVGYVVRKALEAYLNTEEN